MGRIRCGDREFVGVDALVFDKDGTLANSLPFLAQLAQGRSRQVAQRVPGIYADLVYTELMAAWGDTPGGLRPDGLMAVGTRPENEIAAAAYVAARGYGWGEALALVREAFDQADQLGGHKAAATPLFPGVADLLRQAHQAGIPVAVLSGDTTAHVRQFLVHYQLEGWVQWSQGSDGGWAKPQGELLRDACDRLGVSPDRTWLIGDSSLDGELARRGAAAGWICVTWGGNVPVEGARAIAAKVSDLAILPDLPTPHP